MPADSGADTTPPPSQSLVPASGASPSNLLNLIARGANINDPVEVVQQVKAESNAAAKGNPKAKAESTPAAKADPATKAGSKPAAKACPKKVTTLKPASAAKSSVSASRGPLRKPAAAKSASSAKGKRNVMKAALLEKIESSHAKVVKPNKPSGYDKMADICKHIVRRMEHEETEDEEDVDLEDEEGGKKRR